MVVCKKCDQLVELYEQTPKSNRNYWLATELFVELHGRDYCSATDGSAGATGSEVDPGHAQCLYCGNSFHPDDDGPGADYCSPVCYQSNTQEQEPSQ